MQLVALIHEEAGRFGVSFPDLPGCTTVAPDLDTAVAKAREAAAFHIEGLLEDGSMPEARSLTELRADLAFVEDAHGALVAAIEIDKPGRRVRVNVMLDEATLRRVDRAAAAQGETRSGFLEKAAKVRLASA
ncbi:MAG: type II toxin-antitoxin system HicB family antitoxin [Methylobacteriaceae bacterium]|nr:type II toxin-antitoxin system HicB family antitoxin [Methylobacteriaceae bacterium]